MLRAALNAICAFDVEEHPTVVQRIAGEQDAGFWFEDRNQSPRMARRMHDRDPTTAEVDPIAVFDETSRRSEQAIEYEPKSKVSAGTRLGCPGSTILPIASSRDQGWARTAA